MNWEQNRIEFLNTRLLIIVGLLGDYETKLDYSDDPTERQKFQDKIQGLKQKIKIINDEIKQLERLQASEGKDSSLEIPHEDIHETLPEEIKAPEGEDFSLETLDEDIYETLSEEVKAVVEELRQRLEQAKGKTFTFLLIGRTGVGKSSTINSLMGAKVAPVGDFDPCTINVAIYENDLNGAIVRVIDTPGLCDDIEEAGNDAKYIELIRQKISSPIDAALFVSRLDESRVDASEKRGLRLITKAFGELFWKKSVIVFTCSDKVSNLRFEEYLSERTKRIHAALLALQLSNDTVYAIPSVAVDNTNLEKVNPPDGQKWIQQLYLTVLDRAENSSKDVFVLSTSHMLEKIGVAPLGVMEKLYVGTVALNSGLGGSILAYMLGVGSTSVGTAIVAGKVTLTGTLLISNPVGWGVVLASAAIGGGLAYRSMKK